MLARTKNTHGLNKVQSDFRVWDLQINPAWVSWGPGSGINCYISWPSSCCLSQPAWLGPGLARNHGLRAQQCGHFPRRKNTGLGGLLSKQGESCQTLLAPTFHNHFFYCHLSLFAPARPRSSEKLPDSSGSSVRQNCRKTQRWPALRFGVRENGSCWRPVTQRLTVVSREAATSMLSFNTLSPCSTCCVTYFRCICRARCVLLIFCPQ